MMDILKRIYLTTDYMIDMYRSGKDPVFYPDRDVYSEFFKNGLLKLVLT